MLVFFIYVYHIQPHFGRVRIILVDKEVVSPSISELHEIYNDRLSLLKSVPLIYILWMRLILFRWDLLCHKWRSMKYHINVWGNEKDTLWLTIFKKFQRMLKSSVTWPISPNRASSVVDACIIFITSVGLINYSSHPMSGENSL